MRTKLWAVPIALAALAASALATAVLAENIDPFNDNSQFAWSENAGWFNAEPANCGNCGMQVTKTGISGYVWSENLGWINLSCKNDNTCAGPAGNWGVVNNGSGALSGYAWAENAGWISFSCANTSCAGPAGNWSVAINPSTGIFSGYAWGENIGWVSFSDSSPVAYKVQAADDDGDGVAAGSDNCPNWANPGQTIPPWAPVSDDPDCDGVSTANENYAGTNPNGHCATTSTRDDEPGTDQWAADFDDNQLANTLDLVGYVDRLNINTSFPNYNARYDLNANGIINTLDLVPYVTMLAKRCDAPG